MNEERRKFAERFSEIAADLGYKGHGRQTKLAAYYKKAQPSVKKWFDGESIPDYEVCVDMCRRSHVSYDWLMTGRLPRSLDAQLSQQRSLSLVYVDPEELRLVTAYRECTEMGKAIITAAAEGAPRAESSVDLVPSNGHKS